jgi:hypothetical protein
VCSSVRTRYVISRLFIANPSSTASPFSFFDQGDKPAQGKPQHQSLLISMTETCTLLSSLGGNSPPPIISNFLLSFRTRKCLV